MPRIGNFVRKSGRNVQFRYELERREYEKSSISSIGKLTNNANAGFRRRADCIRANGKHCDCHETASSTPQTDFLAEASRQANGGWDRTRRRGYWRTHWWEKGRRDWDRSGRR